jgi:hypothetical protein
MRQTEISEICCPHGSKERHRSGVRYGLEVGGRIRKVRAALNKGHRASAAAWRFGANFRLAPQQIGGCKAIRSEIAIFRSSYMRNFTPMRF